MDKVPDGPLGLPQRIKALRAERGWSQADLAKHINTSKSQVYHWEVKKHYPGMWTLVELAHVFAISLDDLLDVHFGKEK